MTYDAANQRRAAVAGAGNIDHIQIIFFDDAVEMHIDKILTRRGAPMSEQHGLYMRQLERFAQRGLSRR